MSMETQQSGAGRAAPWRAASCASGAICLVAAVCLALGPDTPEFFVGQDKFNHVAAFCCLGLLFSMGASIRGLIRCGVSLTAAAFAVEVMQEAFTVSREGSFSDAFASLVGLAFGMTIAVALSAAARLLGPPAAQAVSR